MGVIATIIWAIWKARNTWLFDRKRTKAGQIVSRALAYQHAYEKAHEKLAGTLKQEEAGTSYWKAPWGNFLKINSDASIGKNGEGGLGAIVRNHSGELVAARQIFKEFAWDITSMETGAMKMGLKLATELNATHIEMESDCHCVIANLKRSCDSLSVHSGLLKDCLNLVSSFQVVSFSFVRRSGNVAAHSLARNAIVNRADYDWRGECPLFLADILAKDLASLII